MAEPHPPLTAEQILAWADAHHERTGEWPNPSSGPVVGVPGQTWYAVQRALQQGYRGLPGGSSLAQFLRRHRRKTRVRRPLTEEQILGWADAHHERTGEWPRAKSGPVADAPGETWHGIDAALRHGHRGLPGGSSLSWLLAQHGREG